MSSNNDITRTVTIKVPVNEVKSLSNLLHLVCAVLYLTAEELKKPSRMAERAHMRFLYYYMAMKYFPDTKPGQLARITKKRYGTVRRGLKEVNRMVELKEEPFYTKYKAVDSAVGQWMNKTEV